MRYIQRVILLSTFFVGCLIIGAFSDTAEASLLPEVKQYKASDTTYYMYTPEKVNANTPILVSIHGIGRNTEEHSNFYVPYAKKMGFIVVAPLFPESKFPDYQTLGQGSDKKLIDIINDVKARTGSKVSKINLSGYSGGAQFAHRFMMRYPEKVERLAIGAAGWYTFPDANRNYWQGLKYSSEVGTMNPAEFLKVPSFVIVGELDDENEGTYNTRKSITEQQGAGRYARGQNWIKAMQTESKKYGYNTPYEFKGLPGVGHDFGAKDMIEQLVNFHFPQTNSPNLVYGPNILKNGSFETNSIANWKEWVPKGQSSKLEIEDYSPIDGKYNVDIYSSRPYHQTLYQQLSVPNGRYEVSAWVRQKQSPPVTSLMQVYSHGGQPVNVNIDHLNTYVKLSTEINVTTSKLGIQFYIHSKGGTRLKIDNVEVRKIQ
ncbi:carbohydrate binding domain-containing protein [Bacillus sp. B190/17]|uniref:Carbohydrate binding domain-containing protein n=1 Tax=Bacillus lumedeiriae TaxID=3058829 RepID=A0ABW8I6V2_9BACI